MSKKAFLLQLVEVTIAEVTKVDQVNEDGIAFCSFENHPQMGIKPIFPDDKIEVGTKVAFACNVVAPFPKDYDPGEGSIYITPEIAQRLSPYFKKK